MTLPAYIPDWFEDNFFDIERLLIHLFEQLAPDVAFDCWTSDDFLDQAEVDPTVWFMKLPGAVVDWEHYFEHHLVQITAITGDPDESKQLMGFVRGVLLSLDGVKVKTDDGTTALVRCVSERAAPFMLTDEQRRDDRIVPATLCVTTNLRSKKRYSDRVSAL